MLLLVFLYAVLSIPISSTSAFVPVPSRTFSSSSTPPDLYLSDYSKWDNLVDEDDDADLESEASEKSRPIPADMKYVLPNIKRQSDTYDAISSMEDTALLHDIWLQSPADSSAWFVGRVARVSDVSPERVIDRQFPLIERHAWALRPVELHPSRGPFVVYYAPGNTEEFVARNDPGIDLIRVEEDAIREADKGSPVRTIEVGFKGAAYDDVHENSYKVDLGLWEQQPILDDDGDEFDFAIPATAEEDAEMQEIADKLRKKDIDKFFDDDDWKEFVDKQFPENNA